MAKVLKPGTEVFEKLSLPRLFDEEPTKGKVLSLVPNERDTYVVEWETWNGSTNVSKEHRSDLLLQSEIDSLEKEYESLSKEIQEKMEAAAKIIEEAQEIAAKGNCELKDLYDEVSPLLNALDNCGWSTSSFHC